MSDPTRQEKDFYSFVELSGKTDWARKTRVVGANGEDITTEVDGNSYLNLLNLWPFLAVGNNIFASYPSATQEVYQFRKSLVVVFQLTVDYTNASKDNLLKVERTL
jgi:hypothetical protein